MWTPISIRELNELISKFEQLEKDNVTVANVEQIHALWDAIKITPQKWNERKYGEMGGGFWVVAIMGQTIIWYNDIEEGFIAEPYQRFGVIPKYSCNYDDLKSIVLRIWRNLTDNK